ncbi:MAG: hypothetical protein RIR12_1944 [Bacteroidota bacterium]|jgi:3-hydroxybutyryl-CoA dehydrogenase
MLAIIGNEAQQEEMVASLPTKKLPENVSWLLQPTHTPLAVCIDLLFDNTKERIALLESNYSLVIVNNALCGHAPLPPHFVSINGWNGFLQKKIIEAYTTNASIKAAAEEALSMFEKKLMWVTHSSVFISTRIIAMIINEAYTALAENTATKEAIDTAMQLGTHYPYGPFEWSRKIGLKRIYHLLSVLALSHPKYTPNALLVKEASLL